jgi:hypothetical protein
VAYLEAGNRHLSAEELVLLPFVAFHAFGVEIDVVELLSGPEPLRLTPTAEMMPTALEASLVGGTADVPSVGDIEPKDFLTPWSRKVIDVVPEVMNAVDSVVDRMASVADAFDAGGPAMKRAVERALAVKSAVWPEANVHQVLEAERDMKGEVEYNVARKLGVPLFAVSLAAHRLWGHSLSAERDERANNDAGKGISPRSLQAFKGNVTRQLTKEIAPLVANLQQTGEQ